VDPELLALLARLTELTPEELATLNARLLAYFEQEDSNPGGLPPAEHADLLTAIADGVEQTQAETTRRETEAAEQAAAAAAAQAEQDARVEAARARLRPAAEPDVPAQPDAPAVEDAPPADRELVTASGGARTVRPAPLPMPGQAPPEHTPAGGDSGPRITTALVAAADVRGFAVGQELQDWNTVGQALVAKLRGLSGAPAGASDDVIVASLNTTYPADYVLSPHDAAGNSEKIDRVMAGQESLVAAGGLCGPLPVDYTIAEVGDLGRPFRDSKARFNADRGGIRTNVPPTLTQADAGVGVWTLANDANPGDVSVPAGERLAAKPVIEFDCGTEVASYVYAVTLRTRFNNIRARFNPEVVASNARMGLVSHARLAELRLLGLQVAASTAVTSASVLGASKDFFGTLDAMCARMRYRQRRSAATALRITLPSWVLDMLRADFVRQMPAGDPEAQYAVADATLERMLAVRNVRAMWIREDLDAAAAGGIGVAQTAGPLLGFPDTFRWFLEYEGDFLFLDGGELDLGVVRDSALNAVNKYETFYETFEGLHFRGSEKALVITSTMNPNGSAAGLVATATTTPPVNF
jgi:hypothetical protein